MSAGQPPIPPPPGRPVRRLEPRPDPPIALGHCATCRFHSELGECRRHAPMRSADDPSPAWPRTTSDAWCGKYEPPFPGDLS